MFLKLVNQSVIQSLDGRTQFQNFSMASELLQLHYPQAGTPVLVMVIFTMIALLAAMFMLGSILKYDTYVNRQKTIHVLPTQMLCC